MFVNADKLTEDGCDARDKDKVCRSRGGESCAFDGAMIVLQPIADTAHIVHGPIACCGNSWEGRGSLSDVKAGCGRPLHRMGFTTDLSEMDIIYGAEEKLYNAIIRVNNEVKPKAVFVYATCVSGLVGEDIEKVCARAEADAGVRVIPVNAPGFVGPKNLGNRIAGEVLLDHVIGREDLSLSSQSRNNGNYEGQGAVNLIGEYNIAGDLRNIEPLFKEAGIHLLSRITGNAAFDELTRAHRADLNVIVCSRALINVARGMERKYRIPYAEVSFFGKTEIAKALRLIASKLELLNTNYELREKIEALIMREEARLAESLKPYQHLRGKKAVLYTGGVKSWSFISALMDLGIEIVAVGTKKSTVEDEEKMKEILGEDAPLVENTAPANLRKLMKENDADILVAGGRNLFLAMKEGFPFVDVNQERHTAYAGYDGLVNFAQQISSSIRFFENNTPLYFPPYPGGTEGGGKVSVAPLIMKAAEKRDVSIDPLKHSQSIGAAIALQGIDRSIGLLHAAQGCNFLAKVLITKHFRDPIALASTKLFTEDVVMGGEEKAIDAAEDFIGKHAPALVGIISSGLSGVKGDDVGHAIKKFKADGSMSRVIHIPAPDYEGGLEIGYAGAVKALLEDAAEHQAACIEKLPMQVNVLVGSHLTPADVTELKEMIGSFGLDPVVLPDLSCLDGSRQEFGLMSSGGTGLDDIDKMHRSVFTLAVGMSMEGPAKVIHEKLGIDYAVMENISGLKGTDALLNVLSVLGSKAIPQKYVRQRRVLVDGMRDAHFYFSNKKICIALEPDLAFQTSQWIDEMAADTELAVVPNRSAVINKIKAGKVIVGDLYSIKGKFDLLISNSHAGDTAERLGLPLYQMGFPVYKRLGYTSSINIGYSGTLAMIHDTANLLMKEVH